MLTFHSIWTKPAIVKGQDEIVLWDFEWLTWLASILLAKRNGNVVLVADRRGKEFVEKAGLASFYDEIVLGLDAIPPEVDPEIFWAAGKLYAIPLLKRLQNYNPFEDAVASLDWDCIPWNYPTQTSEVMCLNLESTNWPWYKDCQRKYAAFVSKEVNWQLAPANNGVFHFSQYAQMLAYSELSTRFMEKFSREAVRCNYFGQPKYVYGDAMTFAEQQLLPTSTWLAGKTVEPFLPVRNDGFIAPNGFFTHLWTTKTLYRAFPEARIHYTNQLIRYLRNEFSTAQKVLKDKGLHVSQHVLTQKENTTWNQEGRKHFPSHNIGIVTALKGKASLRDRNISAPRSLTVGSIILPGDQIRHDSSLTKIGLEFNQPSEYPA